MARSEIAPLVVIVGETGSGKSALALKLAEKFDGEIICADSWTVYKGFDIGTAKPSPEDQARVPHHLLNVADPDIGFSAADFKRLAIKAINDVSARGKLPILVGGTGLYIDSVLYDYSFLPASDPKLRAELNSSSLSELFRRIQDSKLNTNGIDLHNKRRIIRLIENNGLRPTRQPLRANTLIVGVRLPREKLEKRIKSRVNTMAERGFAAEVSQLGAKYGWDIEAFKAPGYRAFKDYVNGEITLEWAKERFFRNDLQLAKKQRTWFKRNNSIQWIKKQSQAVDLITTLLNK